MPKANSRALRDYAQSAGISRATGSLFQLALVERRMSLPGKVNARIKKMEEEKLLSLQSVSNGLRETRHRYEVAVS